MYLANFGVVLQLAERTVSNTVQFQFESEVRHGSLNRPPTVKHGSSEVKIRGKLFRYYGDKVATCPNMRH